MIYGVYSPYSELKEESIRFLNEICFNPALEIQNINDQCDACFFKLGGEAAIRYYTSLLEQRDGFRKVAIASTIAELGEYESTFPIFVEAIQRGSINDILCALDGLKVVGSEEALRLVEEQTHNPHPPITSLFKKKSLLLISQSSLIPTPAPSN